MQTVSVLGLGAMGSRMATRLLDAGHPVVVYNRTPERADALVARGARRAASAAEAVRQADIVVSMVCDDDASQAVWLADGEAALDALRARAVVAESSTLTPTWVRTLAGAVEARGARFLDAPVVGSRPHAEAGGLVYLVGGEESTLAAARGVLDRLGGAVHHVGPVGAGMAMKLAVNALFGVQAAALAEIFGYLTRSGLGVEAAAGVLAAMPTASPAATRLGALMATGSFAPNFPVHLAAKDLRYAVEAAEAVGSRLPVVGAVRAAFEAADGAGHGADDISGIAQLYR